MTHLHCHSYYSFNSGTIAATELPKLAHEAKMTSLALTDTNNMSGAIEFYLSAKAAGINPLLGAELKTRTESAVLLAKNNVGYKEICDTLTEVLRKIPQIKPKLTLEDTLEAEPVTVHEMQKERKPRKRAPVEVEEESREPLHSFLRECSDNVILLSSSPSLLRALAPQHQEHLYIALVPNERAQWKLLREIYRDYKLPIVAENNVMLRSPEEHELHRLLRAIGSNTTIGNTPANQLADPTQSFVDEATLRTMMRGVGEEAFTNTDRIAEQCEVNFDMSYSKFARYPCEDPRERLRQLAQEGFARRYAKPKSEHYARFEFELETINKLGATSYFLATHDMIEFARHKNFPYLGRGSGANSLIAYVLRIANVDPIANNLRFERFLNPERLSSPDFDMDFSWRDRYEVIHYMIDKYGPENAAMLCTIQCYRDRGTVREVGKALGYTDAEINERISGVRLVRNTRSKDGRVPREAENAQRTGSLPDVHEWMEWAAKIHGFPRHLSVHAGGLIIGDKPLTNYCPTQMAPIGVPISQIDMFSAEDLKLIKLDILATRGLGTYWDTMRTVEERTGTRPPVEDERIAFQDEATKALIREGRSKGCFYIESPAMISLLRKLRTDTFENLTAASSVIRPGVSQSGMMQEFIRRHRDPSTATHIHPMLGELMKDTYGVMVYQEDVLIVAHEFAGLSYGEADLFRRAMSGKLRSHERMSEMQNRFVDGSVERGVHRPVAEEVWRQVQSFAGYSFCKAHSASYAVLSFQEAWLKVHHPAEFMCSVLNNFGGFYSHQEYIIEAKRLGVRVKLPDVNKSALLHTVEEDMTIRLGFVAFKDVTTQSLENLIRNREEQGPYRSVEDFAMRSGVTPEDGSILIHVGACDAIAESRSRANLTFNLLRRPSLGTGKKNKLAFQSPIPFPEEKLTYDLSHISEASAVMTFHLERKYLGYAVTHHPSTFLKFYEKGVMRSRELIGNIGKQATIVGYVSAMKPTSTKRGDRMLMWNISDADGMIDVVVWPEEYRKYYPAISTARAFRIEGRVTESFGVPSFEAKKIEPLEFVEPIVEQLREAA